MRYVAAGRGTRKRCSWSSIPDAIAYATLLAAFWEGHDPTQGMRQGADVGSQYRSAIYTLGDRQLRLAEASRRRFQAELDSAGYGRITTEIVEAPPFFYAEDYHQQYLAKNPGGYCGLGGTGVSCPKRYSGPRRIAAHGPLGEHGITD